MTTGALGSSHLGVLVARIRRVTLASGRAVWTGYDDRGRQIVALRAEKELEGFDLYLRETPMSLARAEDRAQRRARRRNRAAAKAGLGNTGSDVDTTQPAPCRSRRGLQEARALEILSRLSSIPEGGDDLGDL